MHGESLTTCRTVPAPILVFVKSVGRKRCLVKQNKCETQRIRSLTYAVKGLIHLNCIRKPLRQNGWPLQPMGISCAVCSTLHSCVMYPVPARVNCPSYCLSPCQACARYFCFTGYRSAFAVCGRIVEATFHLPVQAGILRKLETLTTDGRHVDIGGLARR